MPLALIEIRRILRGPNPLSAFRAVAYPEAKETPTRPQATLWAVDGDGLPPRPWRVYADTQVRCVAMHCSLAAHVCVARQKATDVQRRNTQPAAGQATEYPYCDTLKCAQGRGIRSALDPRADATWSGAGPGGRFARHSADAPAQRAAMMRLAAVGLLGSVPSLDEPPGDVPTGEDGEVSEQAQAPREAWGRETCGRDPAAHRVQARQEREPRRPAEGLPGVPGALPDQGITQGIQGAAGGDGHGRRGRGEDRPRVCVGPSAAVGRGDGQGRRPPRGR